MPQSVLKKTMLMKASFCCIFLVNTLLSFAQSPNPEPVKSYTTDWAQSDLTIDGKLDEAAWNQVDWGGGFVGHQPEYKAVPSQKTQFKILYDAKFLYVGVRAFDTEPEKIVKRMSRRDGFDGDFVEINIDSYNDKRTAFSFTASVSGVKGDEYVSNNGQNWDETWDPIWYLKTSIDSLGWVAEFKIPLSQLRFANKEHHVWGIQVLRRLFREEARSTWQPISPNAAGWVHLFGELNGIKGIKPQKQLEIQPYVLTSLEKYPKEIENPFKKTGKKFKLNAGLDAKIGVTSDITLDLSFNPDFGQVDADPSTVNLSAFQLFFQERRPFFLEGSSLLSFPTSEATDNLFYSRRVGGKPPGDPENVKYIDKPRQTSILGAAKITGKNAKGFSWGVLESITSRQYAKASYENGTQGEEVVAPLTSYLVARAQQDIHAGKTVVGAIATHVRRLDNTRNELEKLHDQAVSSGIDLDHNFKDRKYGIKLKTMFSHVKGNSEAIYDTQTASERYFQRPDNNHRQADSTRTSLLGSAAAFSFGKRSGNWRWAVGSNYKSPALSINDIGFLRNTDDINNWIWTQYKVNRVTKFFRSQEYTMNYEHNNDFGGSVTNRGLDAKMRLEFKNFWAFGQGGWIGGSKFSNADLRGGPAIRYPGILNYWYWVSTDRRKRAQLSFNNWFSFGKENYRKSIGMSLSLNIRPIDPLRISISPRMSWNRNNLQWVENVSVNNLDEYILAEIDQKTYSMSIRANYNITPNLTIEFWGQPFLANANYSNFKRVLDAGSERSNEQYEYLLSSIRKPTTPEIEQFINQGSSDIDSVDDFPENAYGVFFRQRDRMDNYFETPNFSRVDFRSNMVLRWEYIPGSTLFVAWSKNSSYSDESGMSRFKDLASNITNLSGSNTFLIKYTYRFIL